VRWTTRTYLWKPWFAWYPVCLLSTEDGVKEWVWLEWVQAQYIGDRAGGYPAYNYRHLHDKEQP
jgi:hypothetical protein